MKQNLLPAKPQALIGGVESYFVDGKSFNIAEIAAQGLGSAVEEKLNDVEVSYLNQRSQKARELLPASIPSSGKNSYYCLGGIMSAADAKAKIASGASLLEVYTGLIYNGLNLITAILQNVGV